ncbi:AMP-binding protein [Streptomyces sp. NEAU-174]|uniref:AMP-binding protein n=1 Tax=Streptomyces sp. NEAU-174 TaxID=3458254 RepID=UPI004043A868
MTRHGLVAHPAALVERYEHAGAWSDSTLIQQWQKIADAFPRKESVVAPDGWLTYAELSVASDRIAAGLLDLALVPGERVLLQVTNSIGAVLAWFGVLKAGLVPVYTLAAHRHHEIEAIGHRAAAVAHLVEASPKFDMQRFAAEVATRVPSLRVRLTAAAEPGTAGVRIEDLAGEGDPAAARERVEAVQASLDPDDVAVLQLSDHRDP